MIDTDQIVEERRHPPSSQQAQPGFADVRDRVTDIERDARTLIRQRPIVAILAAAGFGYLTARLLSRVLR